MTTALAKRENHTDFEPHKDSSLASASQLKTQDLTFANCDYKELVADMHKQGLQVDCILTDPPYNISRNHQLGFSNMGRAGMDLFV
ncbi:hypothetical protein [Helicobacter sp. MIT 01-3238]|uniref:hypothetical protein n=1 Tax=Helicobacter sp. MIT 01-3238 TaxID=398627 RepID=UPI0011C05939|nr:hypothetical protein [Helicobacter sp. MIT 01-3238]